LIRRGDLFCWTDQLSRSLPDYEAAVRIASNPERRQSDFLSDAYRGLADYATLTGSFDDGHGSIKDGLKIAQSTGNRFVEAQLLVSRSRLLVAQHRPLEAMSSAEEALKVATVCESRAEVVQAHIIMAKVAQTVRNGDKARAHREAAEKAARRIDHFWTRQELADVKTTEKNL
jgi:hypothetical protein